jgi:hypothetical protein
VASAFAYVTDASGHLTPVALLTYASRSSGPHRAVNCALSASAEGCWAAQTGVTGATGFTEAQIEAGRGGFRHIMGNVTVRTPNSTLSHLWISGCVTIKATGVTIKNTLITTNNECQGGNENALGGAINDGGNGQNELHANLLVVDTEVDGGNVSVDTSGLGSVYFECLRCNIHGFTHNVIPGDHGTIRDSYLHGLSTSASGSHEETIYADSAKAFTAYHNFLRSSGGNGYVAAAVFAGNTYGPADGITVTDNYIEGDQGADLAIGCSNVNVKISGNVLSRRAQSFGYVAGPGSRGFWRRDGNTWTGNRSSSTRGGGVRAADDSTCQG